MSKYCAKDILKNFEQASTQYNKNAEIQRYFADLLANKCTKESIPNGCWIDLGTGTGQLADALQTYVPNQQIIRVDNSQGMLNQHNPESECLLWDLNTGVPNWPKKPTLIASSFALHWLLQPSSRLKEWYESLARGGWLAIAVPIKQSFPEWHYAAKKAKVSFTGFPLPSQSSLINSFASNQIKYQEVHRYTQNDNGIFSLLKPIVQVGAQYTPNHSLTISSWKRLQKTWPVSRENGQLTLTWMIQILLIQK